MTIHTITPKDAQKMLGNDEAVLIDVREQGEYSQCNITQARLLPLSRVTMDEAHLPEHKDKKLIIHCRSGKRSMMACEKLQKEAPKQDFYNLDGGIMAWQSQGLPVNIDAVDYVLDKRAQILLGTLIVIIFMTLDAAPEAGKNALAILGIALLIDGFFAKGWFAGLLSADPKRET